MLDLGWSELLLVAIAALIVVGPKDLPRMLRTLGQYAAKAKGVAREFQRSMDEAARQADIDELHQVKKDLDSDVKEVRQSQYKMQREMSQSFMDKPKGQEKGTGKDQGKDEAKDKAKDAPADEAAGAAEAAQPAAPTEPAAPADDPAAPAEPDPRPRKASGA